MKSVDKTFRQESIEIDGNSYTNCTFEECTLEYSGGVVPSFQDCVLVKTEFLFSHQAGNTLHFLRHMYHGGFAPIVDFMIADLKETPPRNKRVEDE